MFPGMMGWVMAWNKEKVKRRGYEKGKVTG
jgi:hypothetical protein